MPRRAHYLRLEPATEGFSVTASFVEQLDGISITPRALGGVRQNRSGSCFRSSRLAMDTEVSTALVSHNAPISADQKRLLA